MDSDWHEENGVGPEDADLLADDDSPEEQLCPSCDEWFLEELEVCPHCGHWITAPSPAEQRSQGWFWPILIAGLVVLLIWMVWHR